jgi:hypothetical protein
MSTYEEKVLAIENAGGSVSVALVPRQNIVNTRISINAKGEGLSPLESFDNAFEKLQSQLRAFVAQNTAFNAVENVAAAPAVHSEEDDDFVCGEKVDVAGQPEKPEKPEKPKKPHSAYIMYAMMMRAPFIAAFPNLKMLEIAKKIENGWTALSEEQHDVFRLASEKNNAEYAVKLQEYKEQMKKLENK